MSEVTLSCLNRPIAHVTYSQISGRGRVLPRLSIMLSARAAEQGTWVLLDGLAARLLLDQELLGCGSLIGVGLLSPRLTTGLGFEVDVPVTSRALEFVDEQLRGNRLDLTLQLHGRFYVHSGNSAGGELPDFPGQGWSSVEVRAGGSSDLRFQVARSDWYAQVLQPLGAAQYVPTEIRIPSGPFRDEFGKAVVQIQEAERAFSMGDDPGTFSRCRAAIDALPGAKKHIYEKLADPLKRDRLDGLARSLGEFLHSGRHVAESGSEQGDFPVDHRDAAFVLSSTKLLVAYTARLVETSA